MFCGAICHSLLSSPKFYTHDDSALISRNLFLSNDLFKIVSKSSHVFRLSDNKISQDVKFALKYDLSNKIPIVLKKIIDVL